MSSTTIDQSYPKEYSTNFEAAIGQRFERISRYVTPATDFVGPMKRYQVGDKRTLNRVTARLQRTNRTESTYTHYWLMGQLFDDAAVFDQWDDKLLGSLVLPTSETMQEQVAAWARQADELIAAWAVGSIYTGATTPTGSALPAGQQVASTYKRDGTSAASGLTYEKVLRALEIFGSNEVDISAEGGLTAFVRMRQITDLYASVEEFRSTQKVAGLEPFNKDKLLVEGECIWSGIRWVHSQRIPYVSSTDIATVPMFTKAAVKFGKEIKPTTMDRLPELSNALQIYTTGLIAASRTRDERVVAIGCDESP